MLVAQAKSISLACKLYTSSEPRLHHGMPAARVFSSGVGGAGCRGRTSVQRDGGGGKVDVGAGLSSDKCRAMVVGQEGDREQHIAESQLLGTAESWLPCR